MAGFTEPCPELRETPSRKVMLYVGALYDAYPLCLPEIRKAHDCIVFTDALPASGAYKSLTSERQILDVLMEEGGRYGITSEFTINPEDGSYECTLKDNCKFKYFFNVSDIDTNILPAELLSSVTTLWMHGYEPPEEDIPKLPALNMVYSGLATIGETYELVRSLIHSPDDEEKVKYYDLKTRIPDVLQWTAEEGFSLAGPEELQAAGLMECDAPFQYEIFEDDDEVDDEEESDDDEDNEDEEQLREEAGEKENLSS
jgi:hypothetical protein